MLEEAAAFAISPEMAKALVDRWGFRILNEMATRPLSPTQFVEEVGGTLDEVGRSFRRLASLDLIELIDPPETEGKRRGAVEHVYRRVQRALFSTGTWENLPREYRDKASSDVLQTYLALVENAVAARTFDAEVDRHLSWDIVDLDRIALTELLTRLDEMLYGLPDLSLEAAVGHGDEAITTTLGLAAFRSPRSGAVGSQSASTARPKSVSENEPATAIRWKTLGTIANKWRWRILMELRVRPMSQVRFVREVGGKRSTIGRAFRQLEELDFIEVFDTQTGGHRRGSKEKVYRLKQRVHINTETWRRLPRVLREDCTSSTLLSYFARINEAVAARTFDALVDRHFSWDQATLDRSGWTKLTNAADSILNELLPELVDASIYRLAHSGEDPVPMTVGLAVFRSPTPSELAAIGSVSQLG